jgi:hypothetical protein
LRSVYVRFNLWPKLPEPSGDDRLASGRRLGWKALMQVETVCTVLETVRWRGRGHHRPGTTASLERGAPGVVVTEIARRAAICRRKTALTDCPLQRSVGRHSTRNSLTPIAMYPGQVTHGRNGTNGGRVRRQLNGDRSGWVALEVSIVVLELGANLPGAPVREHFGAVRRSKVGHAGLVGQRIDVGLLEAGSRFAQSVD